jgi:hypothetical protein
MKKLKMILIAAAFLAAPLQATLRAENVTATTANAIEADEQARAKVLLNRLDEINKMDKSNLSSPQKTALRQEVLEIRDNLQDIYGGIYLSMGAVIIILLLILLLA